MSQSLALEIHMAEEHRAERLMSMSKTEEQVVVKSEPVSKVKKLVHENHIGPTWATMTFYVEPISLVI